MPGLLDLTARLFDIIVFLDIPATQVPVNSANMFQV